MKRMEIVTDRRRFVDSESHFAANYSCMCCVCRFVLRLLLLLRVVSCAFSRRCRCGINFYDFIFIERDKCVACVLNTNWLADDQRLRRRLWAILTGGSRSKATKRSWSISSAAIASRPLETLSDARREPSRADASIYLRLNGDA